MPLTQAQLEHLVCPVCHSPLALRAATVDCTACGRRYPIEDGLPVLLAGRAITLVRSSDSTPGTYV